MVTKKPGSLGNRAMSDDPKTPTSSSGLPTTGRTTRHDFGGGNAAPTGREGGDKQDHGGNQRRQSQKLSGQSRHDGSGLFNEGKGGHGLILFLHRPEA